MRKNYATILFIGVAFMLSFKTYATKITVQVSSNQFTSANVNATVGDTMRWVWVNGSHNTVSMIVPAGAATWSHPINSSNTSFEYVLTVAGAYSYECTFHSGMTGTINVSPANSIQNLNGLENYLEINPPTFKSNAIIKFSLAANAHIKLSIYDFAGRKIQTLIDKEFSKGEHTAQWDAERIPQGIYFCRLENENYSLTRKFVRVK